MKAGHMLLCGLLIAAGACFASTGASVAAVIPAAGCAAMIGTTVWMTMGPGAR
jgi:hypothetical protein